MKADALKGRLAAPLQAQLRDYVVRLLAHGQAGGVDYDRPAGDPGLFGPDSVTWRIHSDFPGMMAGGISALMLQTLHPLALAGVWDHSDFRRDLIGRLRRTTAFVAGTSFAGTAQAQALIEHVDQIHRRVRGVAPDGRRYSARQGALLSFVHATEMWSFLRGYQWYRGLSLPVAVQDRYFLETSRVAEALGARGVPKTAAAMEAYFQEVLPQLEYSQRSATVMQILERAQLPVPAALLARGVFIGAGAALLPVWARELMQRPRRKLAADRLAARSLRLVAPVLRAAMREGVAARACRRVGVPPGILDRMPVSSQNPPPV